MSEQKQNGASSNVNAATHQSQDGDRQLIVFAVGDREYSVDVLAVREIRGWTGVTEIPDSPHGVLGVVNLRGAIIPIVDARVCLGMQPTEPGRSHVVVIVMLGDVPGGLLVDAVSDIMTVRNADIQPAPVGASNRHRLVPELATLDERIVGIVALDEVGQLADLEQVQKAAPEESVLVAA